MNDELQRRLEAADPLAVGEGWTRTPAQLERLKEIALMSDRQRGAARPRIIGFGVVGAAALAGILLAGSFGTQNTLAFSPNGVMATEAQMAAADALIAQLQGLATGAGRVPQQHLQRTLAGRGGPAMEILSSASSRRRSFLPTVRMSLRSSSSSPPKPTSNRRTSPPRARWMTT